MHIHIFWDSLSPPGLQLPVTRMIAGILGVPATVSENHVRIMGYVNERKQIDAQVLLDSIQTYKHRHSIEEPILLVVHQDLFREGAHEVGHLLGLGHCDNPECIMFRPDTLDELDRKKKMFCEACREQLEAWLTPD